MYREPEQARHWLMRSMAKCAGAGHLVVALAISLLLSQVPNAVAQSTSGGTDAPVRCEVGYRHLTVNVLFRVFHVRVIERGAAFTLDVDGRQYIVTAKHLLGNAAPPNSISILYEEWEAVSVKLVGVGKGDEDVLVFAANRQLSPAFPVDAGSGGMVLGQPIRFLGYMGGVVTIPVPGSSGRPSPLVMSGVSSGMRGGARIWIDGQVNPGFSGGPVIFQPASARSREECRWRIAGVVEGYVVAPVDVVDSGGAPLPATAQGNSGLLAATSIESVKTIIVANPIGFELPQSNQ